MFSCATHQHIAIYTSHLGWFILSHKINCNVLYITLNIYSWDTGGVSSLGVVHLVDLRNACRDVFSHKFSHVLSSKCNENSNIFLYITSLCTKFRGECWVKTSHQIILSFTHRHLYAMEMTMKMTKRCGCVFFSQFLILCVKLPCFHLKELIILNIRWHLCHKTRAQNNLVCYII